MYLFLYFILIIIFFSFTNFRALQVERKNRTLLDMAWTMLDKYKTPDQFWAEAINTACYSNNCLYLHRIIKKTSYELLTGKKPNVSYFRVFGSKCFILIKKVVENLNLLLRL
jgi:ABC-type sugar transport system permease subunit